MDPFQPQFISHMNPSAVDGLPHANRAPGMPTHDRLRGTRDSLLQHARQRSQIRRLRPTYGRRKTQIQSVKMVHPADYNYRLPSNTTTNAPALGRLPSQSTLVCTPIGGGLQSTKWTPQVVTTAVYHRRPLNHGLPVAEFPPTLSGVPTEPSSFTDEFEFDSDYHHQDHHSQDRWLLSANGDLIPDDGKDDTEGEDDDFFQRLPIDPIPMDIQNQTCSLLHLALQGGVSDADKFGGIGYQDEEVDEMDAFHTPRNNLALSYYFLPGTYNDTLAPQHRVRNQTGSTTSSSSTHCSGSTTTTTTTNSMFDAALQEEIDRANYYSHRSTVLRLFGFNPDLPIESVHQSLNADFIRTML
ncbi:hypothetical protein H4R33_004612 [Dimargaris cristalligena]|nr:hypothetical protein H4R33_004612 [Dimargaris cristalligena]